MNPRRYTYLSGHRFICMHAGGTHLSTYELVQLPSSQNRPGQFYEPDFATFKDSPSACQNFDTDLLEPLGLENSSPSGSECEKWLIYLDHGVLSFVHSSLIYIPAPSIKPYRTVLVSLGSLNPMVVLYDHNI